MLKIIDTTYTGPDARYREDRQEQLNRAIRDRDFALSCCRAASRNLRALGKRSLPAIEARIKVYSAA